MSDRISELPVASEAIAGNDLVAVTNVSQPGTGETQQFTKEEFLADERLGWNLVMSTWTYASATTITVPSGAALIYSVGDKIRFKQGAGYKYFYIIAVADTLLTVTAGSDYTVATPTAITDNYYSKATSPVGFPVCFNWAPTPTGFSSVPANGIYRFYMTGNVVTVMVRQPNNGTSNATTFTIPAPVPAVNIANFVWNQPMGSITDNGTVLTTAGRVAILANESTLYLYKDMGTGAWTNSGGKRATFTLIYEA
jgi:hypothetical protein